MLSVLELAKLKKYVIKFQEVIELAPMEIIVTVTNNNVTVINVITYFYGYK